MASREVYRTSGTNAEVVLAGATSTIRWPGFYRVRFAETVTSKYGGMNVFQFFNNSGQDAIIRFGLNIQNGAPTYPFPANSIKNMTLDDGMNVYGGFDIENLDATTDIAINAIRWVAKKVVEV